MKRLAAILALIAMPAMGHEFWIEPEAYQVPSGGTIEAQLRVGENFGGPVQAYLPRNFRRFEMSCAGRTAKVSGRAGDRPALSASAARDGLCVVIHETANFKLTYESWEKFENFVAHKDFAGALDRHVARGLPQENFVETYGRYAKSLIAVGSGAGSDSVVGLETEIVAEANPYTDTLRGGVPVRVLYRGAPRARAQVEVFEKSPNGRVEVSLLRTDAAGRVVIPVRPGHAYLADAVVLREVAPGDAGGPVWESLWASLTFAVP